MRLRNIAERRPAERQPVLVSALTGEGLDRLAAEIEARLAARRVTLDLVLDAADGAGLSWLHRHTEVMAKTLREDGRLAITVRADPANAEKRAVRREISAASSFRPPLKSEAKVETILCVRSAAQREASDFLFCLGLVPERVHLGERRFCGVLPRSASARSIAPKRRSNFDWSRAASPPGRHRGGGRD